MQQAIELLKYKIRSESNALREYKKECIEINSLYTIDDEQVERFDEEQTQVITEYNNRIVQYKEALQVLTA